MNIEYKKVVKVDELANLIPFKAGATFNQLWQVFYYTRMFKYLTYRHYVQIKRGFNKVCTYKKLTELCKLGYLKSPQKEVYCATDKVLPILKEAGYITEILPAEPIGKGYINELNNTDVFVPHFNSLLHFNFGYLIPDALLVQINKENNKYKLTFLEIEAKKENWENYIDKKRDNYLRLSKDSIFYDTWIKTCLLLDLPKPKISDLKFSVCFITKFTKDFGKGFSFIEHF